MKIRCLYPLVLSFFLVACDEQPAIPPEALQERESAEAEPQYSPGTLEAEKMLRARGAELTVSESIRGYRTIHGEYPESLEQLVTGGPLDELPELPEGFRYDYDPETGELTVERPET